MLGILDNDISHSGYIYTSQLQACEIGPLGSQASDQPAIIATCLLQAFEDFYYGVLHLYTGNSIVNHRPNTMLVLLPSYVVGYHTCNHHVVVILLCVYTSKINHSANTVVHVSGSVDILVIRELQLCYKPTCITGGNFRTGSQI